jgi:hypothetical protein
MATGVAGAAPQNQSGPAVDRDAPLEREMRIKGTRGAGLSI